MPKLASARTKRPFSITAKLTEEEHAALIQTAERLRMRPSAFARETLLSASEVNPKDRLLLAEICQLRAMIQLLFGGLFAQLNESERFDRDKFRDAIAQAQAAKYRKADESLAAHSPIREVPVV